jgi:hypothetical protein
MSSQCRASDNFMSACLKLWCCSSDFSASGCGLMHVSFLSDFSVLLWLLLLVFGVVETTYILRNDSYSSFSNPRGPGMDPIPSRSREVAAAG